MRAVGLLLLLLLPWCGFAQQPAAVRSPRLVYSETQALGGVTQAELVTRVQEWARRHSRDTQAPVASANQTLVVQGSEDVVYPQQGVVLSRPLHYALTLTVQESSYSYRLTDLTLGPSGQPQAPAAAYQPVELLLAPVASGQESAQAYLLRTAIEEAIGQLLGGLQYDLAHAVPLAHEDN